MADSSSKHTIVIGARDNASSTVDKLKGKFGGLSAAVGALGVTLGGAAIGAFIKSSIEEATRFDTAIRKINTLLPQSERGLGKFTEGLRAISKTGVNQDINQLADGLYEVLSASVPANKALAFTEVASQAATAGFTDMTTSVRALSAVMNAYKMTADDVGKISDILFVTQNRGATTFGQMAEHLGQVLPLASATGVRFEELAAAIATTTRQGINTGAAITGLRSILAGFMDNGDTAKISTLGLVGALEDLYATTGGSQTKIQEYLGRIEGVTIALALMGENSKLLREDLDAMSKAAGTTKDAFGEMSVGLRGQLDILIAKLSELKDKLGEPIAEGFIFFVNSILENGDKILLFFGSLIALNIATWATGAAGGISILTGAVTTLSIALAANPIGAVLLAGTAGIYAGNALGGYIANSIGFGAMPQLPTFNMGPTNTPQAPVTIQLDKQAEAAKRLADVLSRYTAPTMDALNAKIADMEIAMGSADLATRAWATTMREQLAKEMEQINAIINRGFGDVKSNTGNGESTSGRMRNKMRGWGMSNLGDPKNLLPVAKSVTEVNEGRMDYTAYDEWLESFTQKLQNYAATFNYLMSSVTQAIVQGAISGSLTIKTVFQSLRNAVLQMLADLAARAASAWFLTLLFPALSFKSAFGFASGGGWSTKSAPRISPSQFNGNGNGRTMGGGTRVVFNGPVYGSPDAIAAHIEDTLARRMKSGQSRFIR